MFPPPEDPCDAVKMSECLTLIVSAALLLKGHSTVLASPLGGFLLALGY